MADRWIELHVWRAAGSGGHMELTWVRADQVALIAEGRMILVTGQELRVDASLPRLMALIIGDTVSGTC